jgi:protein required for attachment to host cells
MRHWVVVADSSAATIYSSDELLQEFRELARLAHPDSRARAGALVSDDRGRTAADGRHSALEARTDLHRHQIDVFARELAVELCRGRADRAFERLVVVAPPRFLGLVRGHLDAATSEAVVASIAADLMHEPAHTLPARVRLAMPDLAGLPPAAR